MTAHEEQVATIREALRSMRDSGARPWDYQLGRDALAALDSLAAALTQAQQMEEAWRDFRATLHTDLSNDRMVTTGAWAVPFSRLDALSPAPQTDKP